MAAFGRLMGCFVLLTLAGPLWAVAMNDAEDGFLYLFRRQGTEVDLSEWGDPPGDFVAVKVVDKDERQVRKPLAGARGAKLVTLPADVELVPAVQRVRGNGRRFAPGNIVRFKEPDANLVAHGILCDLGREYEVMQLFRDGQVYLRLNHPYMRRWHKLRHSGAHVTITVHENALDFVRAES